MKRESLSPNGSVLSWGLPLVISLSYVYLSVQHDLRLSIPVLIGTTAFVVIMLAVLLYAGEHEQLDLSPGAILFFALFFRLLFVSRVPELSDDMYRYLWDGLQTLRGINPYSLAPAVATLSDADSAALLTKINHPEMVTIYPPVSQLVFATGAAISHSLIGMKILFVALDIATCAIMLKLLDALRLPVWRGTLYAWHPLPIIEIAGSGHIDGVAILLLVAGCLFLLSSREPRKSGLFGRNSHSFLAGTAFAASVLVKFIPLIYLPFVLLAGRKRLMLLIGLGAGLLFLCVPFGSDLGHMFLTLDIYLHNWEFSNFAFRTLRSLGLSGDHTRLILGLAFLSCLLALAAPFYGARTASDNRNSHLLLFKALYGVAFTFLLLSPTLHPWYMLYFVALFPFVCGPSGLVFSSAVFLSYGVLIEYAIGGKWVESNFTAAAIWFSPVVANLFSYIAKRLQLSRWNGLNLYLQ